MSLRAVIKVPNVERISLGTVNRHLIGLNTFFNWLLVHGWIDKNPAPNMELPRRESPHSDRKSFTATELEALISRLANDKRFQQPEILWTFLIAMFSGLRFGEIFDLSQDNIGNEEGVEFFDLRRIKGKTPASRRTVPIHSTLIDLGIKGALRGSHQRGKSKKAYLGYRIAYLFRRFVSADRKIAPLHSLRHSFAANLRQAGVEESLIAQLLGHSLKSTTNRYAKLYGLPQQMAAVEHLPQPLRPDNLRKLREVLEQNSSP